MNATFQHSSAAGTMMVDLLTTPEPLHFSKTPLLEGIWASWLVTALRLGNIIHVPAGTVFQPTDTDLYIILDGCVIATCHDRDQSLKPLFVSAMQRSDMIIRSRYSQLAFSYTCKGAVQALHIQGTKFREFTNAVKNSEVALMATELTMLAMHGERAHSLLQEETSRLLSVIKSLASHPDVIRLHQGVQVSASKEELLTYSGIYNRRVGARAFKALDDAGIVRFHGYKRFTYIAEGASE